MKTYSPLRYPGSKRKLINYFKDVITKNKLFDCMYAEPYAGGASIALSLLIDGYVSKIIINDFDRSIYAFWHSVIYQTEDLCRLIRKTPINIKNWRLQKEIQENKNKYNLLTLGFSTFFLNRTNRSGILTAGPIGGLKQKGKWKIDARYNKEELISKIIKIAKYKEQIEIYPCDVVDLIEKLKNRLPRNTFFYFDPPYFVKGKELYMNHYESNDHKKVANKIFEIRGYKWIVTYDDVGFIRDLYKNYNPREYSLRYSAGKSKMGEEIMANSNNLIMPPLRINSNNKNWN